MTTIQAVIAVIGALGLGTVVPDITRAIIGWFTGRKARETARLARLERERNAAEAYCRILLEHASHVRLIAIEAGVDPDTFPPFPQRPR